MKAIKRVETDLSAAFPSAEITLKKVSLVSAIGRNLGDISVLVRAIDVLVEAGVRPLGVHDLIRKVDLQIIVEPADFEKTISALHKGLIENWAPEEQSELRAA